MINLKENPFYLDEKGIEWVETTLEKMSLEEKIGQLFCTVGYTTDEQELKKMLDKNIGGMMYRPGIGAEIQGTHRFLQENAKIPLLLAANLESGGVGTAVDGTNFGKPLQVAACDEPEQAYRLGHISCREGAAIGCNWAFAPIVDIDMNYRNPITNLRTFGDSADRVLQMGGEYMRGADEAGLAACIKHFPGDGLDERDQHLHVTVNSLSAEDWMDSYGKVYGGLIRKGAKTVMVAHIAQPAWAKKLNPELAEEETYMPASLSKELMTGLLREQLGFQGMIVTDATVMLGYMCSMSREKAVPTTIACGCDMFLFNRDFEEDYRYMLNGYREGIITEERLNEAVTRILGVKASLGLHEKQAAHTLVPETDALQVLGCDQFRKWAKECADKSVTLVKDTQNLLPLTPEKHKRVVLFVDEDQDLYGENGKLEKMLGEKLAEQGFEVCPAPSGSFITDKPLNIEEFKAEYDLAVYAFSLSGGSNSTVVRLDWKGGIMGGQTPWFTREIPTMAISFGNPYHLQDAPMMKTFINAYTNTEYTVEAVVEKLVGKSEFKGKNPVDPFCGKPDARF